MTDLDPVVASVSVPCDAATAFEVFVDDMSDWWPFATHSLGDDRVVGVELDRRVGGRLVEVWDDGTRRDWATVLAWDPPDEVAWSWNPIADPASRPPSTVRVSFAARAGGTLVTVTHTGWEHWGADRRAGYAEGWPIVLGEYAARLARAAAERSAAR